MNELKFAIRQLVKSPGFTAVTVLTLTLGLGLTIAVLSIVRNVILAQPPYPNAERIVLVSAIRPDGEPHSRAWTAGHWDLFKE
jgi:putative ABC transport system permease protein